MRLSLSLSNTPKKYTLTTHKPQVIISQTFISHKNPSEKAHKISNIQVQILGFYYHQCFFHTQNKIKLLNKITFLSCDNLNLKMKKILEDKFPLRFIICDNLPYYKIQTHNAVT